MPVFYAPDIENNPCLTPEESFHAVKVLRLGAGDDVILYDGKGGEYAATIAVADARGCLLNSIVRRNATPPKPYALTIAIAPTKNADRLEWFAEKAAEIGIDRICPIICEYSERRVLKTERIKKILVSAMKQSLTPMLVNIDEPRSFKNFIEEAAQSKAQKLIAHCRDDEEKKLLSQAAEPGREIILLIGPEGDFSAEEVKLAQSAGFQPISLGEARLRVETAALSACVVVATVNGRM